MVQDSLCLDHRAGNLPWALPGGRGLDGDPGEHLQMMLSVPPEEHLQMVLSVLPFGAFQSNPAAQGVSRGEGKPWTCLGERIRGTWDPS